MNALSVVIITQNEERNIERCLKSVSWVDEIVIVDSNSNDKTLEICKKHKCIIYVSEWLGFGKTKKLAVSYAKNDWILSIDADEEVTPKLREEVIILLGSKPSHNGYRIRRNSYYLGKMIKHCGWNKDFTLRLFNKNNGDFNENTVHEFVEVEGDIGQLKSVMLHYTYPDLDTHFNKMKRYAELGAENLYKKNKYSSPLYAVIRGVCKFVKMYVIQLGFLDGKCGFILSVNSAWGVYQKYLLLWEMKR
jgi:glycosyltransferase involved in cell wall biosynthesis